jgi:hypothetical protein
MRTLRWLHDLVFFRARIRQMTERIIIYGVNNIEFPTEQILKDYLSADLFLVEQGRFRYTQCKIAHIMILSQNGFAYGHLIIKRKVDPSIEDKTAFKLVKCTYLVSESVAYHNPVNLYKDFGIRVSSFGTPITREQFLEIQKKIL